MSDGFESAILALLPPHMVLAMASLDRAASNRLKQARSIGEFAHFAADAIYSVVLIPASGYSSEEWWSIWGSIQDMDPRPSILVYAIRSDFEMWSSVLDAGGYDVIVAPFTEEKLRRALRAAAVDFDRRRNS